MMLRFILILTAMLSATPAPAIVGDAGPVNWEIVPATVIIRAPTARCSGVVLASDLVLTAAHCVVDPGKYRIEFTPQIRFEVSQSVMHPRFDVELYRANRPSPETAAVRSVDVALLKLEDPRFKGLTAAQLDSEQVSIGQPLLVVGYGEHAKNKVDWRARMALLTVKANYAFGLFGLEDQDGIDPSSKLSGCKGDSGGPVFSISTGKPLLVGIISGGTVCGGTTIVSAIERNRDWIVETARKLGTKLGQ